LIPVCLNFAMDSQGKFAMAALIFFVLIFIALLHFNLAASVILFAFSQFGSVDFYCFAAF